VGRSKRDTSPLPVSNFQSSRAARCLRKKSSSQRPEMAALCRGPRTSRVTVAFPVFSESCSCPVRQAPDSMKSLCRPRGSIAPRQFPALLRCQSRRFSRGTARQRFFVPLMTGPAGLTRMDVFLPRGDTPQISQAAQETSGGRHVPGPRSEPNRGRRLHLQNRGPRHSGSLCPHESERQWPG